MQTLMLDTIVGRKPILAPSGWSFDKTATIAWAKLMQLTRTRLDTRETARMLKRDLHALEAQIEVLGQVLAGSIGNAAAYWVMSARQCVAAEKGTGTAFGG